MLHRSRSEIAWLPLLLFVAVPVLAIVLFRQYGIFFVALFFNPVLEAVRQIFRSYRIENGFLHIDGAFGQRAIPINDIHFVQEQHSGIWQKLFLGMPNRYFMLGLHSGENVAITSRKDLIFNPSTQQIYFKH